MKIFSRAEMEQAVKLDTVAVGVIRNGFVALAEDRVVMRRDIEHGCCRKQW